jgi:hypothetical protein
MKRLEMVILPVGVGLECEPAFAAGLAVEFEPEVAPPDGVEEG